MSEVLRLFCFAHAGAGAVAFRAWQQVLGNDIQVRPVETPGRGARRNEVPVRRLDQLAELLARELATEMTPPYACFGHSLGALLAFEVLRRVRESGRAEPVRFFVSAHRAPHVRPAEPRLYDLPDRDLVEQLNRLGSGAARLLEHSDLMSLFLPVLRADLELSDTYRVPAPERALTCPITALAARADLRVRDHEVRAWEDWTTGEFDYAMMSGGHFYLEDTRCGLWDLIRDRLRPERAQAASRAR